MAKIKSTYNVGTGAGSRLALAQTGKILMPVLVILLIHAVSLGWAQSSLKAVEIFGTSQITLAQIQEKYSSQIEQFAQAQRDGNYEKATELQAEIESGILKMGNFAYASLSLIQYFYPGQPTYLTIDIVDTKDKDSRMPFFPSPNKRLPDPEGLLKLWDAYMETAWKLVESGELNQKRVHERGQVLT